MLSLTKMLTLQEDCVFTEKTDSQDLMKRRWENEPM
jgi:hypothetical protein